MILAGAPGDELAQTLKLHSVPNAYFTTPPRKALWEQMSKMSKSEVRLDANEHGSVGVVALDIHGNIAAASSSGGNMFKAVGRVGDTAVLGAGLYADKEIAIVW